ncbi:flippase activity-associated protein Agl23 [Halapricum desulfuricans]|uniref:Putative membrane-bound mannosyltransferase n=1 Tax=Halapricum desulfuricans TaxID=2841257 RepID=A0A897N1Q5_9EURY|nr:flippase activity-associated protein Agl23 [Halapricum desulfuricans]QSG04635.1 putative membrane-bound mannosyltransferase [Halapricum desulfuricans]
MDSGRDVPDARTRLRARASSARRSLTGSARHRAGGALRDPVILAVLAITVAALVARLFWLGYRTAHWDEARVAYWILRYEETGAFVYRSIIHGPFVHHATRPLFALFGPSDFVARLPVAVVGGLFPLSALLYRKHLRGHETVLLAFLFAFNSVLLYYSRFLRSDVLVAAFMMTALGFLVRTYDTRDGRYLYPAAVFLGFGIASKENALIYLLVWIGATTLLIDTGLFRPRSSRSGLDLLRTRARAVLRYAGGLKTERVRRKRVGVFALHLFGAGAVVGLVWLYTFAPRGGAAEYYPVSTSAIGSVTLGDAIADPTRLPALIENTWNYWYSEYPTWSDKALASGEDSSLSERYLEFAPQYVQVLREYALPTLLFAAIGFLGERYGRERSRNLILFGTYAGVASVIGYPLGLDIFGPWNGAHPIVVLALPAAAGLGVLYRWGRNALSKGDTVTTVLAALVLLVVLGHVVATAAGAAYVHDTDSEENGLIQYAQPAGDMRYDLQQLDRVAAENDGIDILLFENYFVGNGESDYYHPACMGTSNWFDGLPLSWYLYAADANVTCVQNSADLGAVSGDPPPIIVTRERSVPVLSQQLDGVGGYEYTVYELRAYGTETVILFDPAAIDK